MPSKRTPNPDDFLPIILQGEKLFIFEDREVYDVESMRRDIISSPSSFRLDTLSTEKLQPQLEGIGSLQQSDIAKISDADARRPLIMITYRDGSARLVDDYKRALRALQIGIPYVKVFVLNYEQTQRYMLKGMQIAQALNGRLI